MKTFDTDIFPFHFCVAEFSEHEKCKETFTDADGDELLFDKGSSAFVARALYRDTQKACCLIVINKEYANIGTVAHEANHSAEVLLERIGIFHNAHTSEVYSYVIGFIAQKIYDTIWE